MQQIKPKVEGNKDDLFGEETKKARKRTEEGFVIYTEVSGMLCWDDVELLRQTLWTRSNAPYFVLARRRSWGWGDVVGIRLHVPLIATAASRCS